MLAEKNWVFFVYPHTPCTPPQQGSEPACLRSSPQSAAEIENFAAELILAPGHETCRFHWLFLETETL